MVCELVDDFASDFERHSFTVQSTEQVKNRSEKSTGPRRGWKLSPMMGPEWPL